jgi:uncharacterized membrane protein YfcA
MANWATPGDRTYDNLGVLYERVIGMFIGASLGITLGRDFPSAASLLSASLIFLFLVFVALAQTRSKKTQPEISSEN